MKNYATETDIIKTPDALYQPGDKVQWMNRQVFVRDFAWDILNGTWTYCLVCEKPFNTLIAADDIFERDLKLVFRPRKFKFTK